MVMPAASAAYKRCAEQNLGAKADSFRLRKIKLRGPHTARRMGRQVIGSKFVLYRRQHDADKRKIELVEDKKRKSAGKKA